MLSLFAGLVRHIRGPGPKGRWHHGRAARRSHLVVECLEERCVPSAGITEFGGLTGGLAGAIALGPDGNLWFTEGEPTVNRIGRLNPVSGAVSEFAVPTAGSGPTFITAGPDGNLWFTEGDASKIARITTAGVITAADEFATPTLNSGPAGITAGPDGNLWFAEEGVGKIGRITTAGVITEFATPTAASSPFGITAGPDGNLWFTEAITSAGKIGRITTAGVITAADEFIPLTANSTPIGITTGPDGKIWFTEDGGKIGRITTAGDQAEFTIPGANSHPRGITTGPDGNLWFTEFLVNKICEITAGGFFAADFAVPSGWSVSITTGSHSTLAFAEANVGKIGVVHDVVDANHSFVQALYRDALGRTAAPGELDSWVSLLVQSGTSAVVNGVEHSLEGRTHLVKGWYLQYLGRPALNGEEQSFVQLLASGATEEQVQSIILGSTEYFNHAPQVPGVGGGPATGQTFVQALYLQLLGRPASSTDVSAWLSAIPTLGLGGVALTFLGTVEYRSDVVRSYYSLLLHRDTAPSQAEVAAWVFSGLDLGQIRLVFEDTFEFFKNG
jgi:virginiamycin B lyase